MFCGNCGAKNDDKSGFCRNCGAQLKPIKGSVSKTSDLKIAEYVETSAKNEPFQAILKNKLLMTAFLVVIVVLVIAFLISRSSESALLGVWEERSFDIGSRTITYEPGEGDCFTLGKDGTIIDADHFFGYEFSYSGSVDILSWSIEGDTLILLTQYGDVEYVPYKLSGKTLTLYFDDERSATVHKVK